MKSLMLASVLISCLAAGCISSGTKVTEEQQAQFKVGVTSEAEVIAKLGPPNNVATRPDGVKVDTYRHVDMSMNAAGFVPVVGIFLGGKKQTSDTVTFMFDTRGVLKNISSDRGQSNTNTGLANQQ